MIVAMEEREYITVAQACKILGLTKPTVINMFDNGNLEGYTMNPSGKKRTIRIYKDSVTGAMKPNKVKSDNNINMNNS